jgi:hypothetical protein
MHLKADYNELSADLAYYYLYNSTLCEFSAQASAILMAAGSIGEWAHRSKESYDDFLLNQLNYINNFSLCGLVICDLYRKMKCFFCIDIL